MTLVLTENHGPVRHVVLNRPEKRNALNGELVAAIGDALREAADDPGVRCVDVGGVAVLVARTSGELFALSNRCSHRGGPLHEGELRDATVTCPWHASTFDLRDGALLRGPSAYPQPPWEARATGGRIEVRPV
jgi:nitrite reductase/ring-hydroxylating ferredoxin subunit